MFAIKPLIIIWGALNFHYWSKMILLIAHNKHFGATYHEFEKKTFPVTFTDFGDISSRFVAILGELIVTEMFIMPIQYFFEHHFSR